MQNMQPKERLQEISLMGVACPVCGHDSEGILKLDRHDVNTNISAPNDYMAALLKPYSEQLASAEAFMAPLCGCPECKTQFSVKLLFEKV